MRIGMRHSLRSHSGRAPIRTLGTLIVIAWASAIASCASIPDENRYTVILTPSAAQYQQGVSFFMERRCGTLDCHGQDGRPMRIYGARGLRLPNDGGLTPATGDTTPAEQLANFRAVVGLQPEQMTRVVASGGQNPESLLLLQKPLSLEGGGARHKGGPVIASGQADDGYVCLTQWLANADPATADLSYLDRCKAAGNAF
ncbi:MAG: hypothetical protein ACRELY_00310 [Polyangiaceae bacterium]